MLASMYDYVIVDIDKRLDDINLGVLDVAETIFVVMTADLSCLKNVRLVLETIGHLGYSPEKVKLVLNRSNAFTGITVKNAEGALKRTIEYQIVNEYRGAIARSTPARRSCSRRRTRRSAGRCSISRGRSTRRASSRPALAAATRWSPVRPRSRPAAA